MESSDEGAKLTVPSVFPYLILPYLHLFLKRHLKLHSASCALLFHLELERVST